MNKFKRKKTNPTVIVFDLDETLGSFVQLGIFCDIIEKHNNKVLEQKEFFDILDQNQEYLRPKIIELLQLTLDMKKKNMVDSIMIYTNNQGPNRWGNSIANYFSYKLDEPIFDRIIRAFKINGVIVEPNRTSHEKSYADFLRCTKLPKDTLVYFIDDVEHPKMINNNVYYVNVKPYHYHLPMRTVLNRYSQIKNLSQDDYEKIWNTINTKLAKQIITPNPKSDEEHTIDILTGKLLIKQMNDFFQRKSLKNKSLKKYSNHSKSNKTLKRSSL